MNAKCLSVAADVASRTSAWTRSLVAVLAPSIVTDLSVTSAPT